MAEIQRLPAITGSFEPSESAESWTDFLQGLTVSRLAPKRLHVDCECASTQMDSLASQKLSLNFSTPAAKRQTLCKRSSPKPSDPAPSDNFPTQTEWAAVFENSLELGEEQRIRSQLTISREPNDPQPAPKRRRQPASSKPCQDWNCSRSAVARGLCHMHYKAKVRAEKRHKVYAPLRASYADEDCQELAAIIRENPPLPLISQLQGSCRVDGCEQGPFARGFCPRHYKKALRAHKKAQNQ